MNPDESSDGNCIVCAKDLSNAAGIAHLYHEGRRFSLCCPICVQMFQRAPGRFARGESPKTLVEELLDEIKWKETGRW